MLKPTIGPFLGYGVGGRAATTRELPDGTREITELQVTQVSLTLAPVIPGEPVYGLPPGFSEALRVKLIADRLLEYHMDHQRLDAWWAMRNCTCGSVESPVAAHWFQDENGDLRNRDCPTHGGADRVAAAEEWGPLWDLVKAVETADPEQVPTLGQVGGRIAREDNAAEFFGHFADSLRSAIPGMSTLVPPSSHGGGAWLRHHWPPAFPPCSPVLKEQDTP